MKEITFSNMHVHVIDDLKKWLLKNCWRTCEGIGTLSCNNLQNYLSMQHFSQTSEGGYTNQVNCSKQPSNLFYQNVRITILSSIPLVILLEE